MSLASMIERKLTGPLSSEATLHHLEADGTLDAHGDPATDDTTTTVRVCIFPTQTDEQGDLGQGHFQAFFSAEPSIAAGDWLTIGGDRWDFVGPAKQWPVTGTVIYQEAILARTA